MRLITLCLPPPRPHPRPVRIINVASAAHMFGKIDFDSFRDPKDYKEWPFYGQRCRRAPGALRRLCNRYCSHGDLLPLCLLRGAH